MEILTIIGLIALIILLFVGGSLLGWVIKGLEVVFSFLLDGCSSTLGCIFWVIAGIIVMLALFA
jgi:hypothetical protein